MKKSTSGFLLGFFFGLLGLLGLLSCSTPEEKNEFMSGWWKAFIVSILLVVVLVVCFVSCTACLVASEDEYYLVNLF